MRIKQDPIRDRILNILKKAEEPLETKEIELVLKNVSRVMVLYRLGNLRGEGLIKGKAVGSGKGVWIWWWKKG
jgi:repressor of nif and glnA expression